MSERIELNNQEMEDVIGGILKWKGGEVWPKDNPSAVYYYNDYYECIAWIQKNWTGKQDENTLIALEAAGLVHR